MLVTSLAFRMTCDIRISGKRKIKTDVRNADLYITKASS